jgi:hypothetical protein
MIKLIEYGIVFLLGMGAGGFVFSYLIELLEVCK